MCKNQELAKNAMMFSSHIANVLSQSQNFMRRKENECNFVSLRDVQRAMIVFEYMYDMMEVFGPRMDEYAERQLNYSRNDDDVSECT
jgi:hypothetical protein